MVTLETNTNSPDRAAPLTAEQVTGTSKVGNELLVVKIKVDQVSEDRKRSKTMMFLH